MLWTFFLLPALLVFIEGAPFDQFFPGGPGRNVLDSDYFFDNRPPSFPLPDIPRGPRTPQRPPRPFGDDRRWQQEFPGMFPPGDDTDDVFVFDRPTTPRPQPIQSTTRRTTSRTTSRRTTTSSDVTTSGPASTIANCNCPSTPEFNPVCGTDSTTYTNPGKLQCAVTCGADVSLKHFGSCIPTTTSAPSQPTRRTTRNN